MKIRFAFVFGLPALALFTLAACGGSVALSPGPGTGGAAGSSAGGASGTYVPGTTAGGAGGAAGNVDQGPGGAAGTVTTLPTCIPGESVACACSSGESGAQVCRSDGTYASCICQGRDAGATWDQQQLARLRNGIVGTWEGTETNPWGSSCATTITFEADGHYSAHSPGESCVVFYYGSNDDTPEKTYLLDDVLPTAEGQGEIAFWFGPGDTNAGQLKHVSLSADESELQFEAWKSDYGPFTFTLKRVSL